MSLSLKRVEAGMQHVASRDGTSIACESIGAGPPLVMVVGAFNDHTTGAELATALTSRFSVITYDRRGRGASGDTSPYAVAREVEDLAAVLAFADPGQPPTRAEDGPVDGRGAAVFGFSSGAVLALDAAAAGLPIRALALFDAPFLAANARPAPPSHAERLAALIAADRRGEAVEYFQTEMVGIPRDTVAQMRRAPFRQALEAMAHTLVYDATLVGDGSLPSPATCARITLPTLVLAGAASAAMAAAAHALSGRLPNAECKIIPDQGHDLTASTLTPPLTEFLSHH